MVSLDHVWVFCDHRACPGTTSYQVLGSREGASSLLPSTSFLVAEKQNIHVLLDVISATSSSLFFTCRLICTVPAERIYLSEQDCKKKKVSMCEGIKVFFPEPAGRWKQG